METTSQKRGIRATTQLRGKNYNQEITTVNLHLKMAGVGVTENQ